MLCQSLLNRLRVMLTSRTIIKNDDHEDESDSHLFYLYLYLPWYIVKSRTSDFNLDNKMRLHNDKAEGRGSVKMIGLIYSHIDITNYSSPALL